MLALASDKWTGRGLYFCRGNGRSYLPAFAVIWAQPFARACASLIYVLDLVLSQYP